jgi:polysaccharide export outer membrane protein
MRYERLLAIAILLLSGITALAQGIEFPPPPRPQSARDQAAPGTGRAAPPSSARQEASGTAVDPSAEGAVYPTQTFAGVSEATQLGPGDTVIYSLAEDAGTRFEGTRELRVGADGTIQVPILGTVNAAKKTVRELENIVKAGLEKDYYQTATVRITLLSRATAQGNALGSVYIMGEVNRPGRQEIPPNETFTLTKAITQAGEFGRFANKKEIILTRKKKDGTQEIMKVNYIDIEKGRTPDVELQHDDTVRVKEKAIAFGS